MLIIDIHGHQTLVPKAHLEFREKQMARLADPSLPRPDLPEYKMSVDWAHACNNMIKRVCDLFVNCRSKS